MNGVRLESTMAINKAESLSTLGLDIFSIVALRFAIQLAIKTGAWLGARESPAPWYLEGTAGPYTGLRGIRRLRHRRVG